MSSCLTLHASQVGQEVARETLVDLTVTRDRDHLLTPAVDVMRAPSTIEPEVDLR
jgi:hypothetical protein